MQARGKVGVNSFPFIFQTRVKNTDEFTSLKMVSNSVGGPRICMGIGKTGLKWAYVFNGGQCWGFGS